MTLESGLPARHAVPTSPSFMVAESRRLSVLAWSLAIIAVAVVAWLPWWRNHGYLRDLYDYGLVLAANGHLNLGERPYVDFTTPIQAGFLGLSWLIERAGGGTYGGLTLGGAGLIVAAAVTLPLLLARRWPGWAAVIVGGAVTVSAASQHTILWHNSLGVICLAVATWAAACAPVLRKSTWGWHLLAAAGLFLGGINKLNYQLVAVALCLAWALRAGLVRQAGWGRVLATVAGTVFIGVVLPVAAELAWTGASLKLWFANVVQLPAGARTGILREIFTGHFWLRPLHDYYGPLLLPQVGLVALWLAVGALAGCRPEKSASRWDRVLLPAAALLALAAGAALLATNYEIAPLGLGAWLVLLAGVWLGFGAPSRKVVFAAGLVLPALLLGAAAWRSAWLGQRSQFGYSSAPRSAYVPVTQAGTAFAYLAGLRMPPELVESFTAIERSMPAPDERGYRRVFFGLGTEFMERAFPTPPEKGRPLWVHWYTSYDAAAITHLARKLAAGDDYKLVFTTLARSEWPDEILAALRRDYFPDFAGPVVRRWTYHGQDFVDLSESLEALQQLAGNVDGRFLHQDRRPVGFRRMADGRHLMGTSRQVGAVLLRTPVYRLRGLAAITRLPGEGTDAMQVEFKIITHGSTPEDVRWGAKVELPAGQPSVTVPFQLDAFGHLMELWVLPSAKAQSEGGVFAGYRELEITHAIESTEGDGVPQLHKARLAATTLTPELMEDFFGSVTWRPARWVLYGGRAGARGLELAPGGETWLHTDNMLGEMRGQVYRTDSSGQVPMVRVVWYKGGRLQIMQHGHVEADRPFDFHVWPAEPGGWIGILVDQGDGVSSVQVRVTSSSLTP